MYSFDKALETIKEWNEEIKEHGLFLKHTNTIIYNRANENDVPSEEKVLVVKLISIVDVAEEMTHFTELVKEDKDVYNVVKKTLEVVQKSMLN